MIQTVKHFVQRHALQLFASVAILLSVGVSTRVCLAWLYDEAPPEELKNYH